MNLNFEKDNGLVTAVIQDYLTSQVLMVGYMNEEAYQKTLAEKRVTFFSRTKGRLWTKGEESGNFLEVKEILNDCDKDALVIKIKSPAFVCHTGSFSCFGEKEIKGFLYQLQDKISTRIDDHHSDSYTNTLYRRGINKVAQKVGEEAVELVIEAKDNDENLFKNEAADLLYHFLILLKAKNLKLEDIEEVLMARDKK